MKIEDLGTLEIGKKYYLVSDFDIFDFYVLAKDPLDKNNYIVKIGDEFNSVRYNYYNFDYIENSPRDAHERHIEILEPYLQDLKEMVENDRNY